MEKYREKIIQICDAHFGDGGDYLLFLFGSLSKSGGGRTSDIDLAVYREKKIPEKMIAEIKEELEEKVGTLRDIDLINLTYQDSNERLLENVLKEGILWKGAKNSKELLKNLKKRLRNTER